MDRSARGVVIVAGALVLGTIVMGGCARFSGEDTPPNGGSDAATPNDALAPKEDADAPVDSGPDGPLPSCLAAFCATFERSPDPVVEFDRAELDNTTPDTVATKMTTTAEAHGGLRALRVSYSAGSYDQGNALVKQWAGGLGGATKTLRLAFWFRATTPNTLRGEALVAGVEITDPQGGAYLNAYAHVSNGTIGAVLANQSDGIEVGTRTLVKPGWHAVVLQLQLGGPNPSGRLEVDGSQSTFSFVSKVDPSVHEVVLRLGAVRSVGSFDASVIDIDDVTFDGK